MGTRYGKLPLDDSPRTRVFRAIDDVIRADPTIKAVFTAKGSIRSWTGDPTDKAEFPCTGSPSLRLTPVPGPELPWYPGGTKGNLVVQYEIVVRGLVIDDVDNIVHALALALAPRDRDTANAVAAVFVAAGAMIGEVTLGQPAFDAAPDAGSDGMFRAVGTIQLETRSPR